MNRSTTEEINLNRNPQTILCIGWAIALTWMAVLPHDLFWFVSRNVNRAFSLGHIIGYGILAFLVCSVLSSRRNFLNLTPGLKSSLIISLGITFFWGCFTEILQFASFDRTPSMIDIFLDCFGALGGIVLYSILSRFRTGFEKQF